MSNYAGSAFETTNNEILRRVAAVCRHLTQGGVFTETSPVTSAQVDLFIDDSYYFVLGELVKNGYNPTQTDAEVKQVLAQIQSMDAACSVEYAMATNDSGEPNERYKALAARRDRLITDYLRSDALQQLGATRDRHKSQYLEATGRSVTRKDAVYDDTDVVPSRFKTGFGQRRDSPRTKSGRYGSDSTSDPNL